MQFRIALFPGDGVGPEVIAEGVKVLNRIEQSTETTFQTEYGLVGGTAIDQAGTPLPEDTLATARQERRYPIRSCRRPQVGRPPCSPPPRGRDPWPAQSDGFLRQPAPGEGIPSPAQPPAPSSRRS